MGSGSKVGVEMSRERCWGVPGAESEGQAFFPIPEGEWGGWGLNWGRGTWREAHLGEEAGFRLGNPRGIGRAQCGAHQWLQVTESMRKIRVG